MAKNERPSASADSSNNPYGTQWNWGVNTGYTLETNASPLPVPAPEAPPTQTAHTDPVVIFPTPLYTNIH